MATRTGIPSMLKDAKNLIRLIAKFLPTIQKEFPANTALLQAMQDCSACLLSLVQLASEEREQGD